MSNKYDFNDLSGIIFKEEEDSGDETINNINLILGGNNNIKTNSQKKLNNLDNALDFAKSKFDKLCKNSEKIKSSKFIPEIIKDNIHLQYIFKDIGHLSDMLKVVEIKKKFQNEGNSQNNNSFNTIEEKTKDTYSTYKIKDNIKNDNYYSDKKVNNNFKDINKNINDDTLFFDNFENNCDIDKLKSKQNYDINQLINNNNLNVNVNKKQNFNFIGKKRGNKENNKIENLFNEIKVLFNKYIGKSPEYKLFEQRKGIFEKNITVVEKGIPSCIIYFNKILEKIYLIKEQIFIEDENDIIEILDFIKNNILKYKDFNPFKFEKNN